MRLRRRTRSPTASIVPREAECANLLVPVCLSAAHIAYGSIRMEPVFMVLGQSAATAASLAIDAGAAVQDVGYPALRRQLLRDRAVLEWPPPPPGLTVEGAGAAPARPPRWWSPWSTTTSTPTRASSCR